MGAIKQIIFMDRRHFFGKTLLYGCGAAVLGSCNTTNSLTAQYVKNPFDLEVSREFVLYAHSDVDKVKELYLKSPHLINATVDWGDGDFESALGAASHVGSEEIANFLISKGARMDLFTMAMLGMTSSVITILKKFPEMIKIIGPHGFTLLHHSEIGVNSPDLSTYLKDNGLKDEFIETFKK